MEPLRDLLVAHSGRDQIDHLPLPLRQSHRLKRVPLAPSHCPVGNPSYDRDGQRTREDDGALGPEQRSKPVAEQAVVVDQEEAQFHDVLARYARATPDATFLAKLPSFGLDVHTNTAGEVARGARRATDATSARCARGRR